MNYICIYFNIINHASTRVLSSATRYEKHHILPKSICNDIHAINILNIHCDVNDINNLVYLTTREHYICHLILPRIFKNNKNCFEKMIYAANIMCNRTTSSHEYQKIKEHHINILINALKGRPSRRKGIPWSEDTRLKMSELAHLKGKTYEEIHGNEKAQELKKLRKEHATGIPCSESKKHKLSLCIKTEDHKKKISLAKVGVSLSQEHKKAISKFFGSDSNPNIHKTLYIFQHNNGERIVATKLEMKRKYDCKLIHKIIDGTRNKSRGWTYIGVYNEN